MFDYTALVDCELYVIAIEEFKFQLASNVDFVRKILDRTAKGLIGTMLKIDALEKPHAKFKIIYSFRSLALQYGSKINDNLIQIDIPLTQQDLANFTGLTRETTNMELNNLKKENIIDTKNKYYVINIANLNNNIDDEFIDEESLSIISPMK